MADNKKKNTRPTQEEIVKGKIANALTSAAKNHIVATTDDLYDTNLLKYQDEINKSLDSGITEILDELQYVAKEDTLVGGITKIREDISEIDIDTTDLAKEDTLVNAAQQADTKLNEIIGVQADTLGLINTQTGNILNTVNTQAQAINTNVANQTGQIISSNNQQTATITSTVNQQAQSTNIIINNKTADIINTVNTQAQSLANDIVNLDGNLDSGVTRIFDAINVIKEELQGQNSAITLTYLYDMLGDLSTLLDEINGEEMPVEFATDYARQGENSGATNTAILEAILGGDSKQTIVNAINQMGGSATADMTWAQLAQQIQSLTLLSSDIEFVSGYEYPFDILAFMSYSGANRPIKRINYTTTTALPSFQYNTKIEYINAPFITGISGYSFQGTSSLRVFISQEATIIGHSSAFSQSAIEKLYVPKVASFAGTNNFYTTTKLIDLIIGAAFVSSMSFSEQGYNPTEAYRTDTNSLCYNTDLLEYGQVFSTNWDKWKWCIINHFAANVPDRTGLTAYTITFGSTVLSHFDAEMIAAFTNKNWTLA